MKNVTGQVVRGLDFFDRESEQGRYWSDLETDNLLLLAPRRVGKTSVMKRMQDASTEHGYSAVFVDVSDAADEAAFVRRICQVVLETDPEETLWSRVRGSWLADVVKRVKKIGGPGFAFELDAGQTKDWSKLGWDLADALTNLDGRWLILVDELPVFVLKLLGDGDAGSKRAREFLYWMRRLRLEHPKVRWMLAGSIGLDTVTARLNLADAINDLRIVTLGAYDPKTAHALLSELGKAYEIELSETVRQRLIDRIGWPIPYYLQLAFHELRARDRSSTVTAEDVDQAFSTLLQPSHRSHFDYWRQRLHDELGSPDSDHALDLLAAVCHEAAGTTRETLAQVLGRSVVDPRERDAKLRYLLDVLQSDGYLAEQGRRWVFRFPLLRDFWLERVVP
jgi:uncharacterized protein